MVHKCELVEQGFSQGACYVNFKDEKDRACVLTLRSKDGEIERLTESIHLSRPENYLSIYQSGCNLSCKKCHSWYFSKNVSGEWRAPKDILELCKKYEENVTHVEPREHATAYHAHESCRCCGFCVMNGERAENCPGKIQAGDIILSPQGWGPARNIVAFTGGDVTCRPEFYAECTRLVKEETNLWMLLETNGFGLTEKNLDILQRAGVDSFWLDIKAFDEEAHKWLTGCSNERILKLPKEMVKRNFVVEVLSLYIPGLVEEDQLEKIAELLVSVDPQIPFSIIAFFPEHRMKDYRKPKTGEMIAAYKKVKAAGLRNVRLGNLGVFLRSDRDYELLLEEVGKEGF